MFDNITVTRGFLSSFQPSATGLLQVVAGLGLPRSKQATIKKGEKLARNKNYDPKGKQHLLDAGVNKEKQYILNWMRKEYGNGNVSEGIWIALANHIESIKKQDDMIYTPLRGAKSKMTAQEKFIALVEKWG